MPSLREQDWSDEGLIFSSATSISPGQNRAELRSGWTGEGARPHTNLSLNLDGKRSSLQQLLRQLSR